MTAASYPRSPSTQTAVAAVGLVLLGVVESHRPGPRPLASHSSTAGLVARSPITPRASPTVSLNRKSLDRRSSRLHALSSAWSLQRHLLLPAPWQVPQTAHREEARAAPEPSERPECPDEEEAASGLGDLGIMCPSHVDDGHACGEQPDEQHDDEPRSPFGENERPVQQDGEDEQRNV